MKTFRFTVASIRYHKKAMIIYAIAIMIATSGLIISYSLLYSLERLLDHSQEVILDINMRHTLFDELPPVHTNYQIIFSTIFSCFILFFACCFFRYQQKKKAEYIAWRNGGASSKHWFFMQLLEVLLPLLVVSLLVIAFLLLMQPILQNKLTTSHLHVLSQNQLSKETWSDAEPPMPGNLILTIPQTSQALIQMLSLSNYAWLNILFVSIWHTISWLISATLLTAALITSFHCLHWRKTQWKNQII